MSRAAGGAARNEPVELGIGRKRSEPMDDTEAGSAKRRALSLLSTILWGWRKGDGEYKDFSDEQCAVIEKAFLERQQEMQKLFGSAEALNSVVKFHVEDDKHFRYLNVREGRVAVGVITFSKMEMTFEGERWMTEVRRWDRKQSIGQSWDHQLTPVSIHKVNLGSMDYSTVSSSFFDRQRDDSRIPVITRRDFQIDCVQRVQNIELLSRFQTERNILVTRRGEDETTRTETYGWHGSSSVSPKVIAMGSGLMTQYGSDEGFYGRGSYAAYQASYSHDDRYVHRTDDVDGNEFNAQGKYFHLLLVRVLRGKAYKTTDIWKGDPFSKVMARLGTAYDSVEGGPHRPSMQGPCDDSFMSAGDDSLLYVAYNASQFLPEFIVTYSYKDMD